MISKTMIVMACALPLTFSCGNDAQAWAPKQAPLMTKWAAQVDPRAPLPEYPRPQMVRSQWLNLNGIWQFQPGAEGDAAPIGKTLNSEILVPFPVESALSGVMEHHPRLWYRRTFTMPQGWRGQQIKLNFGAIDYESEIFVNGQSVGTHVGGYEAFSYDITPFLKGTGPQELIVRVFDPTEKGGQPRGKQTTDPRRITYTPTTGIWQTVWLEPVARNSIVNLRMTPDIDAGIVKFLVAAPNAPTNSSAVVRIKDGDRVIQTVQLRPNIETTIPMPNAKLWSPDSPFLYDIEVGLNEGGKPIDRVESYFGMRKISLGQVDGATRMLLNNKFVFQLGPLDQGYWPDGNYTAPTDEALKYDLEVTKQLGFNMTRKHIKIESARWYYHADKLGLLVWQDMPSGSSYLADAPPLDKAAFEKQLVSAISSHWNHPSIVMWVIFNEGESYYDAQRLINATRQLDPSRLVNRDSGMDRGADRGAVAVADKGLGDILDVHTYPEPTYPAPLPNNALVCGEYGGIGYFVESHSWTGQSWGYVTVPDVQELHDKYGAFTNILKDFQNNHGLSGAVYTQITDVEKESNGLMTYDRLLKVDATKIRLANSFNYPITAYNPIVPTSERRNQNYQYTLEKPANDWFARDFAATGWKTAPGGFGTAITTGAGKVGTVWDRSEIWLRRNFNLPNLNAEQVKNLVLTNFHDEDVEIYINGVLAYSASGYVTRYEQAPINEAARAALVVGGKNVFAIHCKQTRGGQYVDVGLAQKIVEK